MQIRGICQEQKSQSNRDFGCKSAAARGAGGWYSQGMRLILLAGCLLIAPFGPGATAQAASSPDYSGMYSFLREGEFVQITIEDKGGVSGFISRFGDSESDRGVFLDQFFKAGKMESDRLTFTTENVHGTWFEFAGILVRGPGKKPDEEGYYVARGKLTRFTTDADQKTNSQSRQVEFKSFPRDSTPN